MEKRQNEIYKINKTWTKRYMKSAISQGMLNKNKNKERKFFCFYITEKIKSYIIPSV